MISFFCNNFWSFLFQIWFFSTPKSQTVKTEARKSKPKRNLTMKTAASVVKRSAAVFDVLSCVRFAVVLVRRQKQNEIESQIPKMSNARKRRSQLAGTRLENRLVCSTFFLLHFTNITFLLNANLLYNLAKKTV